MRSYVWLFLLLSVIFLPNCDTVDPLPNIAGTITGTIAGSFEVNGSGASTYKIPIATPPGTAGIVPKLAFEYSSGKDSGLLGLGWALTGFSAVARCPANLSQDGYIQLVNFDSNDRFCLDGQKLSATSGVYGADNTEYRTQPESFSKVVSHGRAGNGPASFTVYLKNGLIYEYGDTADSRLEGSGRNDVLTWQLRRISDRSGNYLSVSYQKDSVAGEVIPLRVDYTGNSTAGLTPYNSIRFEYELRSNSQYRHVNGTLIGTNFRVKAIRAYTDENIAWSYNLSYRFNALIQEDQLVRIQECDNDAVCVATSFTWGTEPTNGLDFSPVYRTAALYNDYYSFPNQTEAPVITGDWNGDGKMDFARIRKDGQFLAYGRSASNFLPYANFSLRGSGDIPLPFRGIVEDPVLTGDWNGDGRSDFATIQGTTLRFFCSTGSGFALLSSLTPPRSEYPSFAVANVPIITGDWNGDGRTDFLHGDRYTAHIYYATDSGQFAGPYNYNLIPDGGASEPGTFLAGDWNGDGLTDFAVASFISNVLYVSTGGSFSVYTSTTQFTSAQNYGSAANYPFAVLDWNADGLSDMARVSDQGLVICDSTGVGLGYCQTLPDFGRSQGWTNSNVFPLTVGDWNGDGYPDVGRVYGNTLRFYLSKSGHFIGPYEKSLPDTLAVPSNSAEYYPLLVADWNGDGVTDIGRVGNSAISFQDHVTSDSNFIVGITDNLGATISIKYAPLTDSAVYLKGVGAVYPNADLIGSAKAVASVSMSNGLGSASSISYRYSGLRYNAPAQSILGFAEVDSTDESRGITTSTFYSQEPYFTGLPTQTDQRLANGTLISRKQNTWTKKDLGGGNYFSYISQTNENSYELDGSLVRTVATSFTYDSYMNLTQKTVSLGDGSSETTVSTVNNDIANWLIGQLTDVQVTKVGIGAGATPITRSTAFTYKPSGLLLSESFEPGNTALGVTKSYDYDAFGNIRSVTLSAVGLEPRSMQTVYDSRGRFPLQTINSYGHTETREYDPRHGKVTSVTDINGMQHTSTWDGFGRPVRQHEPDGTESRTLYYLPDAGAPANAAYYTRVDTSGSAPIITYFDEVGREIRKVTVGFNGQNIFTDKVYDERGQLSLVSLPYFEGETARWNAFEYDALGRTIRVTEAGGRITSTVYAGLVATITNPLQQRLVQTFDARGNVISVKDNADNLLQLSYDGYDHLIQSRDPAGNTITTRYDLRGNKIQVIDPDTGTTDFTYNAYGELFLQVDARRNVIRFAYDKLGRIVQRLTGEGTDTWTYDSLPHGIGKPATITGGHGFSETYTYDSLGRISGTTKIIDGQTFSMSQTFDAYSRLKSVTYPDGFVVNNSYNSFGMLSAIKRGSDNFELWKVETRDARGNLTQQRFGNGLQTTRTFDADTGFLRGIATGAIQNLNFSFDAIGNLKQRSDALRSLVENFTYDGLNRLTQSQVVGQPAINITYDNLGNILSRSDVGTYLYGNSSGNGGPHAAISISGPKANSYQYDAGGNRIAANNQTIAYSSTGQPIAIIGSNAQILFSLDPNDQRTKETTYFANGLVREKFFFGPAYEKTIDQGLTQNVHYIQGTDGPVVNYITASNGQSRILYLHADHLGSVQTISDENKNVVEVQSYDSWGLKRNAQTWTPVQGAVASLIDRGYTGHEQLDEVGLIHMNGRIYDPTIGRFISADPLIQSPLNLQSLNRYTYVNNNPLSFTDPSGLFLKGLFRALRNIVRAILPIAITVAAAFLTNGLLTAFGLPESALGFQGALINGVRGAAAGIVSTTAGGVANGGSLGDSFKAGIRGAPVSALRAVVAFGIGEGFNDTPGQQQGAFTKVFGEYAGDAKIVAHGLGGGITGTLSGQSFLQGFAAGAGAEFSAANDLGFYGTALAGGTGAALSGGKFSEGAVQGAFIYLYNHSAHQAQAEAREHALRVLGTISPNGSNYHRYDFYHLVAYGDTSDSALDRVFALLRLHPAPGWFSRSSPVNDGDILSVFGAAGFGGLIGQSGQVMTFVDSPSRTITNVTLAGHIFDPGLVQRSVVAIGNGIYIRSFGIGNNSSAGWALANEVGAADIWKQQADLISNLPPGLK